MAIWDGVKSFFRKDAAGAEVLREQGPNVSGVAPVPDNPRALLEANREWVFACVTKNAEVVASTPLRLYTTKRTARTGRRGKWNSPTPTRTITHTKRQELESRSHLCKFFRSSANLTEVLEHPFYDLWDRGNPFMTGTQQQRLMSMHLDLVGDHYTLIQSDDFGPIMIMCLPPETMQIKAAANGRSIAMYVQTVDRGEPVEISPADIMHCKFPDPKNMLYGMSPLEAVGLAARLYTRYNEFEIALIENDGIPGTLIHTELPLTEDQKRRYERKWKQQYNSPHSSGKVAFVSGIKGVERIGYSQREMMFQTGRKLTREDIAGVYNIPIPLLLAEGSALAQAQDAEKHHARYAIKPRLKIIEEQINRDIISKYEGAETLFAAFDDPVPEDRAHNLERARVMLTSDDVIYKNEVRVALELGADPDMEDELIEKTGPPSAMPQTPDGESEEDDAAAPDSDEEVTEDAGDEKGARRKIAPATQPQSEQALEETMRSLFARQGRVVLEKTRAAFPKQIGRGRIKQNVESVFDAEYWVDEFNAALAGHMLTNMNAGAAVGMDSIGLMEIGFDIQRPEIGDFIGSYTYRFSTSTNSETQRWLRDTFTRAEQEGWAPHELTDSIQDYFGFAERYRAARIGRTEVARSRQAGQIEVWKQSGVVQGFYWETTTTNPCPFCLEMESRNGEKGLHHTFGQTFVDAGSDFTTGDGRTMNASYGAIDYPPLHPNCGCDLVPVLMDGL